MRSSRLPRCLIAALVVAPAVLAQPLQPADPQRFQQVRKWVGTVTVSMSGGGTDSRSGGRAEWSVNQTGSFSLDLDRTSGSRDSIRYEGRQTGSASIDNSFTLTLPNDSQMGVRARGGQEVTTAGGRLTIDLERGTYSIDFDKTIEAEVTEFNGPQKTTKRQSLGWFGIPLPPRGANLADPATLEAIAIPGYSELPLPAAGMTLAGTKTLTDGAIPAAFAPYNYGFFPMTVAWSFAPEGEGLELVIDVDGYDAWMPEPGHNEDAAGNQVTVRATLQKRGGGDPPVKAKQFEFAFVEVSNMPGIAMNFPAAPAAKMTPDLRFDGAGDAPTTTVAGDGTRASTIIHAHDGGATAILKVTAIPEDGSPAIEGYLNGSPGQTRVRLPKRREGSRVADAWRTTDTGSNSEDASDDEAWPVGDGHSGDGFTVYEEYRGFVGEGRFQRLNAKRKELFVHDTVGGMVRAGLQLYERESEITVRRVNRSEVPLDRIVNFNSPGRAAAQTAVRIAAGAPEGVATAGGTPGPPSGGQAVLLPDAFARRRAAASGAIFNSEGGTTSYANYIATIAHEVLHRSSAWHHGEDLDRSVDWDIAVLDDGRIRAFENGSEVTLLREDGSPATATNFVSRTPDADTTIELTGVTLGVERGQHSGNDACIMRYDTSLGYQSHTDPKVRYVVEERTGVSICRGPRGTGVNDAGHQPQSRYGDASPRRGNCVDQICVRDSAPPVAR